MRISDWSSDVCSSDLLSLIEDELKKRGVDYAILTGQTRDRRTPVKEFQSGKSQIFLISLKAGGVGLNLTEADRKSVVWGKRVSVSVDLGGRRIIKKKKKIEENTNAKRKTKNKL